VALHGFFFLADMPKWAKVQAFAPAPAAPLGESCVKSPQKKLFFWVCATGKFPVPHPNFVSAMQKASLSRLPPKGRTKKGAAQAKFLFVGPAYTPPHQRKNEKSARSYRPKWKFWFPQAPPFSAPNGNSIWNAAPCRSSPNGYQDPWPKSPLKTNLLRRQIFAPTLGKAI